MALVKSRAITLKTYKLGETSKVVVCYTRDFGKVRLVAKGARKGGGRLGAALEPMVVSGVVFYLRPGRELNLVSQAEIERQWQPLRRDVVRMAYGGAVVELTDALVSEGEEDGALFDLVEATLARAAEADDALLDVVLWGYEVALSRALGYGPELSRCVVCGRQSAEGVRFSPRRGGIVCPRCLGEAPGAWPLSEEAADIMAGLPDGTVRDAGAAVRDEVGGALLAFLGEHAGHELKLRSLEFLAQIRRTGRGAAGHAEPSERHEAESEREHDG
jgi:DNA repair protein RecO (recombination protein O)